MKILIVEDEAELADSIAVYLGNEKYLCDKVADLGSAKDKIIDFQYDCVIVDLGLPDGNGLEVVKLVKKMKRNDGLIIISANSALNDKLMGLNLGADDYLAKPFHLAELGARLNSVIRRRFFEGVDVFEFNEIKVNVSHKTVLVHNVPLNLNKKELDLLLFLVNNKNRVVSKSAISEHLSQSEAGYYQGFDIVYAHMKNLKKKIAEAGGNDYVKTIYGVGYKFEVL